jgi:dephospho-CoA kinase
MVEEKIIIGLVSPISAGKGTVIKFLEKKGFFCSSLSDRIREEITFRGEEISRENLLTVADELRQDFGPDVLARRTWQVVLNQPNPRVGIDSIRGIAEVNFFKTQPNFYLIGLNAPREKRFAWTKARSREGDPLVWEDFVKIDERDFFSQDGKIGRNIKACLEKADFLIENDGSIADLEDKIAVILKKIL